MTRIRVEMKPVSTIVTRLGVDKNGEIQRFATNMVNRRIERYMPYRSGMLSTKLKFIKSPTEIEVLGPYARYMYYGKVMVDAETGKGPANIPGVGLRFRKNSVLKATNRDLNYDRSKNPLAGPYWDRRLVAAERKAMQKDLQDYANRRRTK